MLDIIVDEEASAGLWRGDEAVSPERGREADQFGEEAQDRRGWGRRLWQVWCGKSGEDEIAWQYAGVRSSKLVVVPRSYSILDYASASVCITSIMVISYVVIAGVQPACCLRSSCLHTVVCMIVRYGTASA